VLMQEATETRLDQIQHNEIARFGQHNGYDGGRKYNIVVVLLLRQQVSQPMRVTVLGGGAKANADCGLKLAEGCMDRPSTAAVQTSVCWKETNSINQTGAYCRPSTRIRAPFSRFGVGDSNCASYYIQSGFP